MSFFKNNIVVALSNIGTKVHTFFVMSLLINSISLEAYSDYVLVLSFVTFIAGISSFGVGFFYKRNLPSAETNQKKQELFIPQFTFNLLFSLIIILLLIVLEKRINNLFGKKMIIDYYLILCYFFLYVIYSQATDYFRYSNQMTVFSAITLMTPYLWLIGIFFQIQFNPQAISLNFVIGSIIVVFTLVNIVLLFKIYMSIGFSFRVFAGYNIFKDIMVGLPLVLVILGNWVITASDRFFILKYLDKEKVAFYSASFSIGTIINFLPLVLGVIMPPLLSLMVDRKNTEQANKYVNYSIIGFLAIAIPFCVGAFFTGENILSLISKYSVCSESKYVVTTIGFGALINGLIIILSTILFVQHRTKKILYATIIGMGGSILINSIVLPKFQSIITCSFANIISNILTFIFISVGIRKGMEMIINYRAILKIIISTAIMILPLVLVGFYFNNLVVNNLIQLTTKIFVAGVTYIVSILLLFPTHRIILSKLILDKLKTKN